MLDGIPIRAQLCYNMAKIKTKLRKKNDEQFIFKKIAHRVKVVTGMSLWGYRRC
jgi:hypothetical protein